MIDELGGDPNESDSISEDASKIIKVEDIMNDTGDYTIRDTSRSREISRSRNISKTVRPDYDSGAGDELPEPSESESIAESIRNSDKIGGVKYNPVARAS